MPAFQVEPVALGYQALALSPFSSCFILEAGTCGLEVVMAELNFFALGLKSIALALNFRQRCSSALAFLRHMVFPAHILLHRLY